MEIAAALELAPNDSSEREAAAKEALMSFRELLKKSEKCSLNEDRTSAS